MNICSNLNKKYVFVFILLITLFSVNSFIVVKKQRVIILNQKISLNKILKLNNELDTKIKILLNSQNSLFNSRYVIYTPQRACSSCLRDIILYLNNKNQKIWENTLLYFDIEEMSDFIDYMNDAYNLKLKCIYGNPLIKKEIQDIIILKYSGNSIKQIIIINKNDLNKLDKKIHL